MARIIQAMDGNQAAAHGAYAFSDLAAIYPITPSTGMAERVDQQSREGRKNLFGRQVAVTEMQSEAGAAGVLHGALQAGALATTFTASQGLLLMLPNMYKMAGEQLPCVIHAAARTVATHALSIFGDHSDVYACRQTGFGMLASGNPQEAMDLAVAAHLAAIQSSLPFLHFFDGFRTSHQISDVEVWSTEELESLLDKEAVEKFRARALRPSNPVQRGTAQNPDVYFQIREGANGLYDRLPATVEECLGKVNRITGKNYQLFNYYGAQDAQHILVAMGSVCDTAEETIDYYNSRGEKWGLVKVRLYRPFVRDKFLEALPKTAKTITVLDKTKEPGALGEPLWLDVTAALAGTAWADLPVYGGRFGLASKDTTPAQIAAVYRNAQEGGKPRFTIGITDDATHLSLPVPPIPDTAPAGTVCCKFWGLGADGTVSANKNAIKIIGEQTGKHIQAYFAYDSKKSGGVTVSHLRFGEQPIRSAYLISQADLVACHCPAYLERYDMTRDLKPGGIFLLNCSWDLEELSRRLPDRVKSRLAQNDNRIFLIDAIGIAQELGLGGRVSAVLSAAFFGAMDILPRETAAACLKEAAAQSYGSKGEKIVARNHAAIDLGFARLCEIAIPDDWKDAGDDFPQRRGGGENQQLTEYLNKILLPVASHEGDAIPVSAFLPWADGTAPMGTTAYEKRGIAVETPAWLPENCIQCNFCAYVCPHSVIRPAVLTEQEASSAPEEMKLLPMTGMDGLKFAVTLSVLDCTGCGLCVQACPGKKGNKALTMKPLDSQLAGQEAFAYGFALPGKPQVLEKFPVTTVKGSQFRRPLLEFPGACAGCGETPYAKLVTQLYGDRMIIANATGCSSIWGGSFPSTPYTVNDKGEGPAWANSLFEDNAEFGYGIYLAGQTIRRGLMEKVRAFAWKDDLPSPAKAAAETYLERAEDTWQSKEAAETLLACLSGLNHPLAREILAGKEYLAKRSVWMFGGDGWAYDIGFGGLDHILASGEDVNILVFDTQVYSNTGGQASKATPAGAVAHFASQGKETCRKDLGLMAMTYGNVYVASVAMGADYAQTLKAIAEGESYRGPSLIIAYATCISHGIQGGMSQSMVRMKEAVEAGFWVNYRFDPRRAARGENPLILDSPPPKESYQDFLQGELRFSRLSKSWPERGKTLFDRAAAHGAGKRRYLEGLVKLFQPGEE